MTTIPEVPVSPRTEAVRQVLPKLRELIEGLEGLTFLTRVERLRVNTTASVRDRFLAAVAAALEAFPLLASIARVTPAQLREVIAYSHAARTLADELERLLRGVRDTITARR